MWWKDLYGDYVNADLVEKVEVYESSSESGGWYLRIQPADRALAGPYETESDAREAAGLCVRGFDANE